MEFGILGPLAVWEDGAELELGPPKPRAVLAILLMHAGETMSTERLVDALWDEKPPATAVKALHVYVSQLRKALGDGVVETRPPGYVVRVEDGALDLQRFERLLDEGRQLLAAGAPVEAGEVLRRALALWRGTPLADFRYEAFAHEEILRLEALRLIALEHRLEADLAVGRHGEAIPELETLIRDYPLRERLRELLMLALYRSGRQADALAVMQEARATLRDELGLDPSQALQRLEKAILLQDPSLDAAPAAVPPEAAEHHVRPRSSEPASAPEVEVITRAQRKVVTVLFADVAGSTEFGESLDPEALRALLATYFEQMKAAADRHGGVVEKFIGDAVMAVFGVPAVHEDDALRALRAAMEMRDAIAELGIEGRIGVESGEVVVGTDERLVTGRAVTSAARLEQAAQPGEILVGEGTIRLAGEAATAERIEPLELKGKREPVPAWRLLSVSADAPARRFDSPFVGRERELGMLDEAWARVCTEERCELVTVLGVAGVGKSRLVSELVAADRRGSRPRPMPLLRGGDHVLARSRCRGAAAAEHAQPRTGHPTAAARAARRPRCLVTRRARVGVPQVRRGGRSSAAAHARLRRHPVGRGSTARPDRACRVRVVRRADPARVHGAAGAARPAPGLARSDTPRAAHPPGSRTDDLDPDRGSRAGRRDVAAHRRGRRRQPAVRPGVGGDAGGVER